MRPHTYLCSDASALVKTGPGLLSGAALIVGPSAITLTLYDNTVASGAIIAKWKSSSPANQTTTVSLPRPIAFSIGLYAVYTGAGGRYNVFYE
jgi:hypothetical protein